MGNRLKVLRKEKGITVRELGEKLKISYPSISKMENNQQNISNEYLKIFTDFFEVSGDYLLGLSNTRNPKKEIENIQNNLFEKNILPDCYLCEQSGFIFKKRIKELLFERNITQQELATAIKITPATLSRNMNGLNPPKAEVVIAIANFFNVSTDYLLGLSNVKNDLYKMDPLFFLLYDEIKYLTNEEKQEIINIVKSIKKLKR